MGIDSIFYPRVYFLHRGATQPSEDSSLNALYTTRRDHLDAPRPLPGSGQAKSSTMQPLDSCRTPPWEDAKPCSQPGRTPNTKCVTRPGGDSRGNKHGAENRFHWLALVTGPDGKSIAFQGKTMNKLDQQGNLVRVGIAYQFLYGGPGPEVTCLMVEQDNDDGTFDCYDVHFKMKVPGIKADRLFRPLKHKWSAWPQDVAAVTSYAGDQALDLT